MSKYIQQTMPAETLQKVADQLNSLADSMKPYSVTIKSEQKAGVRTMAEGREGLVRLIEKIAHQHTGSLSRSEDPNELTDKLQMDSDLESIRQALLAFLEMTEDTQWGNGADIMALADRYASTLQTQRGHNASLDSSLAEVDDWNKRYGPRPNSSEKAA